MTRSGLYNPTAMSALEQAPGEHGSLPVPPAPALPAVAPAPAAPPLALLPLAPPLLLPPVLPVEPPLLPVAPAAPPRPSSVSPKDTLQPATAIASASADVARKPNPLPSTIGSSTSRSLHHRKRAQHGSGRRAEKLARGEGSTCCNERGIRCALGSCSRTGRSAFQIAVHQRDQLPPQFTADDELGLVHDCLLDQQLDGVRRHPRQDFRWCVRANVVSPPKLCGNGCAHFLVHGLARIFDPDWWELGGEARRAPFER